MSVNNSVLVSLIWTGYLNKYNNQQNSIKLVKLNLNCNLAFKFNNS